MRGCMKKAITNAKIVMSPKAEFFKPGGTSRRIFSLYTNGSRLLVLKDRGSPNRPTTIRNNQLRCGLATVSGSVDETMLFLLPQIPTLSHNPAFQRMPAKTGRSAENIPRFTSSQLGQGISTNLKFGTNSSRPSEVGVDLSAGYNTLEETV